MGRQIDLRVATHGAHARDIQPRSRRDDVRLAGAGPAKQDGSNPRNQLARAERLGDVVVRSEFGPMSLSVSSSRAVSMMIGTSERGAGHARRRAAIPGRPRSRMTRRRAWPARMTRPQDLARDLGGNTAGPGNQRRAGQSPARRRLSGWRHDAGIVDRYGPGFSPVAGEPLPWWSPRALATMELRCQVPFCSPRRR